VFSYRRSLIFLGIVSATLATVLQTVGAVGYANQSSTVFTALFRFLPLAGLAYILATLVATRWKMLTRGDRWGLAVFFLLFFLSDFSAGKRGALFAPMLIALIVLAFERPDSLKIRPRTVLVSLVVLVFAIPPMFNLVESVRRAVHGGGTPFVALTSDSTTGRSVADVGAAITDRLGSFDATFDVITHTPSGLRSQLSPTGVLRGTVGGLIPDRIWSTHRVGLGVLYARYYQRLPPKTRSAGAWSGFGTAFGLFGWWGFVAVGAWGFLVGAALKRWSRSALFVAGMSSYTLFATIFLVITSGNIDTIMSEYFAQMAACAVMLGVLAAPRVRRRLPIKAR
jgi:hypothetical protein